MFLKILGLIYATYGYIILDSVKPQIPKILKLCNNIDYRLANVANEIDSKYNVIKIDNMGNTGTICNKLIQNDYGYMTPLNDGYTTDIWIKNSLLSYETTLYNVLLHEILHSIGLNHNNNNTIFGLMSYAITIDIYANIIYDQRKLWYSRDDFNGIKYLRHILQNNNQINETKLKLF